MRRVRLGTAALGIAAAFVWYGGAFAQSPEESQRERRIHELCVEKLGPDAEPIRATVTSDKAILTGEVTSRAVRHLAKEVALVVPGIRDVDDQVTLVKSLPLTGKVKEGTLDVKLEIAAKARLESEVGGSAAKALEVEAVDGWVSLRGSLPDDTKKDQAIHAVEALDGVDRVIDLINVVR